MVLGAFPYTGREVARQAGMSDGRSLCQNTNPGFPGTNYCCMLNRIPSDQGAKTIMNTCSFRQVLVAGLLAVLLGACGGSGSTTDSPALPAADATGFLSLALSDGPVHDAEKVCITFDAVEFKGAGEDEPSTTITLDPAAKINLLDFQGMNAAPLLVDEELAAGDYEWIRLAVDASRGSNGGAGDTGGVDCDGEASYIVMNDGSVYNLFVPSGDQTGLKLVSGYTVPANASAAFTIEFDLMKSITAPPGLAPDVILKPALRLVNNVEVGALTGRVDPALATAEDCAPAVFLFDDGVTPNPIDDGDVADPEDPVATALVNEREADDGSLEYHYSIGFLLAGDYEAAFTCDGETFEPAEGVGVSIAVGETTIQDF